MTTIRIRPGISLTVEPWNQETRRQPAVVLQTAFLREITRGDDLQILVHDKYKLALTSYVYTSILLQPYVLLDVAVVNAFVPAYVPAQAQSVYLRSATPKVVCPVKQIFSTCSTFQSFVFAIIFHFFFNLLPGSHHSVISLLNLMYLLPLRIWCNFSFSSVSLWLS